MYHMLLSVAHLFVALAILSLPQCEAQDRSNSPTLELIREAWTRRQARLQTGVVTWKSTRTLLDFDVAFGRRTVANVQTEDYSTVEIPETRLVLGSHLGSIRLENEDGDSRLQGSKPFMSTSVFNGSTAMTYVSPRDKYGTGLLFELYRDGEYVDIRPIIFFCRPFNTFDDNFRFDRYKVEGGIDVIDGRRCTRIVDRAGSSAPKLNTMFYLDVDNEFIPIRYMEYLGDSLVATIDVKYQEHKEFGWVPHSWSAMLLRPSGEITSSFESTVKSIEFNVPVSESEFELVFPKGTMVADLRGGENVYLIDFQGRTHSGLRWGDDPLGDDQSRSISVWVYGSLGLTLGVLVFVVVLFWRRR